MRGLSIDRSAAFGEKWGLHPISARAAKDDTVDEASTGRWVCPRSFRRKLGLGLAGALVERPGTFSSATLSEVLNPHLVYEVF
jgi:hypothetical protein